MRSYVITTPDDADFLARKYSAGAEFASTATPIDWTKNFREKAVTPYSTDRLVGYKHPLVAAFLHPCLETYLEPRLWECEASGDVHDDGIRVSCTKLNVLGTAELVRPSLVQYQRFAVACGMVCCQGWVEFMAWSDRWINEVDRTSESAVKVIANQHDWTETEGDGRTIKKWSEDEGFGRDCAVAAMCSTAGDTGDQDWGVREVYAAAAGWRLWSNSGGKNDLVALCRFAMLPKGG